MSRRAPRNQQPESRWRDLVNRWQKSKLTQAAFCRLYGLEPAQFSYWKHKLLGTKTADVNLPAFIPVRVEAQGSGGSSEASSGSAWSCEIEFASGAVVRLRHAPSTGELWRLGSGLSEQGGESCG